MQGVRAHLGVRRARRQVTKQATAQAWALDAQLRGVLMEQDSRQRGAQLEQDARTEMLRVVAPAVAEAVRAGRCLAAGCQAPGQLPAAGAPVPVPLPALALSARASVSTGTAASTTAPLARGHNAAEHTAKPASALISAPPALSSDSAGTSGGHNPSAASPLHDGAVAMAAAAAASAHALPLAEVKTGAGSAGAGVSSGDGDAVRCHVVVLACRATISDALGAEDSRAMTLQLLEVVRTRAAQVRAFVAEVLADGTSTIYFGYPNAEEDGEERACTRVPGLIHAERYAEGVSPQWWLRGGNH